MGEPAGSEESPRSTTRKPVLAALLSALVPGTGHLLLGLRRKGWILLALFAVLLLGFWPIRLLSSYAGFVFLYASWIALFIYASWSALLAASPPTLARSPRWWLTLVVPFSLVSMSLLGWTITRASGFRSFIVPSTSMEGTIRLGDHLVADMRYYRSRPPSRQDLIFLKRDNMLIVRRVIAVGGDTVEEKDGRIVLNGHDLDEPYVIHGTSYIPAPAVFGAKDWRLNFGPIQVPSGKYFALGDNRDISLDSRSPEVGLLDRSSIIGKTLYIFGSDRVGKRLQ